MAKKYLVISSNNQISLTDHLTGEATQAASVVFEVKTMLDAVTIDIVKVADGRKLNLVKEEEPASTSTTDHPKQCAICDGTERVKYNQKTDSHICFECFCALRGMN